MKKNQNFPFFWVFISCAYFASCLSMLICVSNTFSAEPTRNDEERKESVARLRNLSDDKYEGTTLYDGYIPVGTLNISNNNAIISLRGTDSYEELKQSLSDHCVPCSGYFPNFNGYMFGGYLNSYENIKKNILLLWQYRLQDCRKICLEGYSRGGALAVLLAITLHEKFKNARITVSTYGAPSILSSEACQSFDRLSPTISITNFSAYEDEIASYITKKFNFRLQLPGQLTKFYAITLPDYNFRVRTEQFTGMDSQFKDTINSLQKNIISPLQSSALGLVFSLGVELLSQQDPEISENVEEISEICELISINSWEAHNIRTYQAYIGSMKPSQTPSYSSDLSAAGYNRPPSSSSVSPTVGYNPSSSGLSTAGYNRPPSSSSVSPTVGYNPSSSNLSAAGCNRPPSSSSVSPTVGYNPSSSGLSAARYNPPLSSLAPPTVGSTPSAGQPTADDLSSRKSNCPQQ